MYGLYGCNKCPQCIPVSKVSATGCCGRLFGPCWWKWMKRVQCGWAVVLNCNMSSHTIHSHRLGQYNRPGRWSLGQAHTEGCWDCFGGLERPDPGGANSTSGNFQNPTDQFCWDVYGPRCLLGSVYIHLHTQSFWIVALHGNMYFAVIYLLICCVNC